MFQEICDLYGVEGIDIKGCCIEENRVIVFGYLKNERLICHKCGSDNVIFIGVNDREFHLPPTGSKKAILKIKVRRNQCKKCNSTWWPQMPFTEGKQRMSQSFINYVLDLLEFATIKDVANYLEITWDTVKSIHKKDLKKKYNDIELKDVKYISIDEISISRGHKYMTVIADIKTGRILYSVEGRKKKDIRSFLKILKKKPLI